MKETLKLSWHKSCLTDNTNRVGGELKQSLKSSYTHFSNQYLTPNAQNCAYMTSHTWGGGAR